MSTPDQPAPPAAVNEINLDQQPGDQFVVGWPAIAAALTRWVLSQITLQRHAILVLACDGYPGTAWLQFLNAVQPTFAQQNVKAIFINVETCLKTEAEIQALLAPFLGTDPVFGKIFRGDLQRLFDLKKLHALNAEIHKLARSHRPDASLVVVLYGTGAGLKLFQPLRNLLCYLDLSREEVLRRKQTWQQIVGKTQSISPKKLYYVDFPVNDAHRNRLLAQLDYYLDGNQLAQPVLVSQHLFHRILKTLAQQPLRLKPIYEPGPWGGQWLKKVRHLPTAWVNCAWSYEVIAPEQSLLARCNGQILEFPWTTFFHLEQPAIMGSMSLKRFGGQFPIRYDYLDTMEGGDLSIQVHPTTPYIRKHFREPYHQGEMYYIVAAENGTTVNLGLQPKISPETFYQAARQADEQGVKFDYRQFVNQVPSQPHDLLLIPPGTVHGSGAGQVVLEISATTYRYTFKIYDHLRPDLNGIMRPIHVAHAFNVIKWFRRGPWIAQNLIQTPVLVRSGADWAEYRIGDRREFFHVVFRLEFEQEMLDDTAGKFHILTLVAGESVQVSSLAAPEKQFHLHYSETLIVPAAVGKYRLINTGTTGCKIVKARLR